MTSKTILLAVADPQALVDITQALGSAWDATSVATDTDALAQLEERSFDALLADFNLGETDASDLLNLALEKRPETTRFLLAYEADLALVAAKVQGSAHILPKPVEPASLKTRLDNVVNDSDSKPAETEPAPAPSDAPAVPPVYGEVLKALESPDVTHEQVGEIIAQDEALTSEVLRLTNSSYLGLPQITDPAEAVHSLGLEAVKALVMALQFLAEHSRLKPAYLSLDQLWVHSVNVAQIARDLVLFETKDRTRASQALTAGLLHDLGKVVLVSNFDDLYGRVHSLARKQPVALWDVEKEMFGANHGEIGACLVGMWNMPSHIVEAVALHHEPPLGETQHLTPLAAVHIANVLERELQPRDDDMMVAPIINTPFLNELGLLQRLPVWRAAFANHLSVELGPEVETESEWSETGRSATTVPSSTATSRTANQLPASAAETRTTTSGHGDGAEASTVHQAGSRKFWIYAGIVAGVLAVAALWLRTEPELNQSEPVHARTPATREAPAVVSSPAPETAPAAAPQPAPATVAVAEEPPAAAPAPSQTVSKPEPSPAPSTTVAKPAVSQSAPESTAVATASAPTAPAPTVTSAPPPAVAHAEPAWPDFRVTGIIFSARPSAIVNGAMVNVGDHIEDATVVRIARTAVTLQMNGKRKNYELR
jgi:HD-like signal output (HDOD) protein